MKDFDVIALGELLIDFTESGRSEQGNPLFEANPGGAPCNVLAILSRLGHKTAFIGKVGEDSFGRQAASALEELGISTAYLQYDKDVHTTLAFVHKLPDGDRDFSFYRRPGADMMLRPEEIAEELFKKTKIFHCGSLSLTDEPVRSASRRALELAKEAGCLISFDPNLRKSLWENLDDAKKYAREVMAYCDVLKISDNEILFYSGEENYDEAAAKLLADFPNIRLLLLSMGKEGSRAYYQDKRVDAATFILDETIETTGAGDAFCGSMLHQLLIHDPRSKTLSEQELYEMLRFANAAAALVTTKKGALRVMPEPSEIEALLQA